MREYLLVFLVAAAVTYLLTVIAREIALRTGAVAAGPRPRRARRADPLPRRAGDARRPGRGVRRGPRSCRSSRRSEPVRLPRRRRRADRRRDDLRRRRARRHLRARRADQARRAGAGRRASWSSTAIQFYFFPSPTAASSRSTRRRARCSPSFVVVATVNAVNFVDGLDGLAAGVVGDRRAGVLRLLLPAGRRSTTLTLATTGGAAERRAGRRLRRASCRTTSTRPGSSWATAARC